MKILNWKIKKIMKLTRQYIRDKQNDKLQKIRKSEPLTKKKIPVSFRRTDCRGTISSTQEKQ